MRTLSAITEPDAARQILEWLDMSSQAPPLGAPSAEPEALGDDSSPERPWDEDPGFDPGSGRVPPRGLVQGMYAGGGRENPS